MNKKILLYIDTCFFPDFIEHVLIKEKYKEIIIILITSYRHQKFNNNIIIHNNTYREHLYNSLRKYSNNINIHFRLSRDYPDFFILRNILEDLQIYTPNNLYIFCRYKMDFIRKIINKKNYIINNNNILIIS